jgi:hypothetical protein
MFRNYPLTCLFILATICVDLVVALTSVQNSVLAPESGLRFKVWNFGIPAQVSTLALWAIYGTTHRLTKATVVTFAGGILLLVTAIVLGQPHFNESISFNFIQILFVLAGGTIFWLLGIGKSGRNAETSFRFSLVEMFGWSMIVALWAFALRSMNAGLLVDRYFVLWIVTASVTPILLIPVHFSKFSMAWRCGALGAVFGIVLAAYGIADRYVSDNPIALWALSMSITQIIYITAWRIVWRMDEAM